MSIILYAIPVFFILIAAELVAERARKTHYYRINDAITSLSIGVVSRVTGVLRSLVPLTFYVLIFQHFALFEITHNWLTWAAVFVAYDFLYYWNHRFGHERSLFWATHVVHHSSEDYNLTTALRQSSGSIFNFIFFLPLAFAGVDPVLFVTVASVNLVYQFWVHTQHIRTLGWLEWVLVTPMNHRVHHAQNAIYLDRNYGGVFIVWDRLFCTYQEELEHEKPIYGVRKALNSFNPIFANLQVYTQLIKDSWGTRNWGDKFKVWFGKTGWRPNDMILAHPLEKTNLNNFTPYDVPISGLKKSYCLFQYMVMASIGVYLMMNTATLSVAWQITIACFLMCSSVNIAWLMENRSYAASLEWIKTAVMGFGLFVYFYA